MNAATAIRTLVRRTLESLELNRGMQARVYGQLGHGLGSCILVWRRGSYCSAATRQQENFVIAAQEKESLVLIMSVCWRLGL